MAWDSGLIGRDGEMARLRGLVDPPPQESRVLVLLGDARLGKSVLLADAGRQAGAAGLRVLQVTGRESEQDLAFAGLHQLLRPVLDRVPDLPDRQAKALLGAFALSADPTPPDALLTGIAVLTLLSQPSRSTWPRRPCSPRAGSMTSCGRFWPGRSPPSTPRSTARPPPGPGMPRASRRWPKVAT